jgi:hypothetical protein
MGSLMAASAACLMLAACATNPKVSTNQLTDADLSCKEISTQDKNLDDVLEKAQHNKGVSGANVAAVLLFWPAAVGNYMDADKAEQLVNKRKTVLADLYKDKHCG